MGIPAQRSTRSARARRTWSTGSSAATWTSSSTRPTGSGARTDGWEIRRAAVARGVPCLTTLAAGVSAARAIAAARRTAQPAGAVSAGAPPRTRDLRCRGGVSDRRSAGPVAPLPQPPRPPDARSVIYPALFNRVLRRLAPEQAHRLAAATLRAACRIPGCAVLLRRSARRPRPGAPRARRWASASPARSGSRPALTRTPAASRGLGLLGFGFVEIGTVTAHPQPGNPPPRVFRVLARSRAAQPDGLSQPGRRRGRRAPATPLRRRPSWGPTSARAWPCRWSAPPRTTAPACACSLPCATTWSSTSARPTRRGSNRCRRSSCCGRLLREVQRELRETGVELPLLVKVGPDLAERQLLAIADLALELGLDGIVAVNTSEERTLLSDPSALAGIEGGGVSGPPLGARAVRGLASAARAGREIAWC